MRLNVGDKILIRRVEKVGTSELRTNHHFIVQENSHDEIRLKNLTISEYSNSVCNMGSFFEIEKLDKGRSL